MKRLMTQQCFVLFVLCFSFLFSASQLAAQEAPIHKKITIIKKTIDENGVETVEKIVKEGTSDDVQMSLGDIDIEVLEDGQKIIKKRIIEKDGEGNIIEENEDIQIINIDSDNINVEGSDIEIISPDCERKIMIWTDENGEKKQYKLNKKDGANDVRIYKFKHKTDEKYDIDKIIKELDKEGVKINGERSVFLDIDKMKEEKSRAFLGVTMGYMEGSKGVLINSVIDETAASKAGLKAKDIITELDGKKVKDASALIKIVDAKKPGDEISIAYLREGKLSTAKTKLLPRSESAHMFHRIKKYRKHGGGRYADRISTWMKEKKGKCRVVESLTKPWLGVYITDDKDKGAYVESVIEETAAEKMGLQEGDIIYKINNTNIGSIDELIDFVKAQKSGDLLKVKLRRANNKIKVKGNLGERKVMNVMWKDCGENSTLEEEVEKENIESWKPLSKILNIESASIYPNPSNGTFNLKFQLSEKLPISITVVDVSGKEVYTERVNDFDGFYDKEINVSEASNGVFFVNIAQGDKIFSEKIIINKGF